MPKDDSSESEDDITQPPDVAVLFHDLNISTFEIVSGKAIDGYRNTVNKAIVEILRAWRNVNTSVDECHSYVFPKANESSCVMKVSVKFEEFHFKYTLQYLENRVQIEESIKQTILEWSARPVLEPGGFLFIRLRQEELNGICPEATQIESLNSIILYNEDTVWKCNKFSTSLYHKIATRQVVIGEEERNPNKKFLQHSLLPFSKQKHFNHAFFKFRRLQKPLSRERARPSLIPLLEGLYITLQELHGKDIAHLDVRLPNICIDGSDVVLIDLDRCDNPGVRISDFGSSHEHLSDMYLRPRGYRGKWTNRNTDWRSVGMVICFILDTSFPNFHKMLSHDSVDHRIRDDDFVKVLLQEGRWDDTKFEDFKEKYSSLNEPIDSTL